VKRSRKPLSPEKDPRKTIINDAKTDNASAATTNGGADQRSFMPDTRAIAAIASSSAATTGAADRNTDVDHDVDMKDPKIEDDHDDDGLSDEGDDNPDADEDEEDL
jgi:hypothetical protein